MTKEVIRLCNCSKKYKKNKEEINALCDVNYSFEKGVYLYSWVFYIV